MGEYGVYSDFDIEKHKQTFVNYLEVLILEDGKVMYAVPSHQELAIKIACEKLGISREELMHRCPPDYYCDFLNWLLHITGAIAVWNRDFVGWPNPKQIAKLKILKLNGIYKGPVTEKRILPWQDYAENEPREEIS